MTFFKVLTIVILPVIVSLGLFYLDKKTKFSTLSYKQKQLIYGAVFGILAILGNELGVQVGNAQANCRDAAVLTAGLMFGGPAGIMAGLIGGVERYMAVWWGRPAFTRIACSLSTIIAGFYAAALRKYMFNNKKPQWLLTLAIGVVMEVFHLTMVFVTNISTPVEAMEVVKNCIFILVFANALSVTLSSLALTLANSGFKIERKAHLVNISQTIQQWLLVTVLLAFTVTSFFVFTLQNKISIDEADTLLDTSICEIKDDITDKSDENILRMCKDIIPEIETDGVNSVALKYDISEINIVDKNGIIIDSTEPKYVGFDMKSGEQAREFMVLVDQVEEYVQAYGPTTYDPNIMRKYAGVRYGDGYIQIGYDAEMFQKDIDSDVIGITKNRHVGSSGYVLIIDKDMQIISAPSELLSMDITKDAQTLENPIENHTYHMEINGTDSFIKYSSVEGYYIVSIMPTVEVYQTRDIVVYVNAFMEVIVFAVMFGIIYLLIKKVVVDRIMQINDSLSRITGGDLNIRVNVRTNKEFASLSDDINETVGTLKKYIAEASARLDAEIEFAKNVQLSAQPNVFPAFPKRKDFDIYATTLPAKEVGGDFYDFYMTGNNTLHFLVADVSGKGIPAAMFMMRAKTELKSLTETEMPLNEVFTHSNQALCDGNDAGMFVTCWQGSLDLESGLLKYCNAGHNPPLIKHQDGSFEYLRTRPGFVLAGMEGVGYKLNEFQLSPGDMVFLYTDGVTEATNSQNELFGEDRLLYKINSKDYISMQNVCRYIKSEIDDFVGIAPQFDDITMVALKYIGTPPPPTISFETAAIEDITKITAFVEAELEKIDCPMKATMQISVAIDELYSNIVKYGYKNTTGPASVSVIIEEDHKAVSIRFIDRGVPYNPLTRNDPDITLSAEERSIGGLGIFVVKKTMDDIKYKYENEQNILTITKRIGD